MATVLFEPTPRAPFQFVATFDGAQYTVVVTWNTASQRWYVNTYDQNYTLIFSLPLIGSPVGSDISMTGGYFTSTLVFRTATRTFEIAP